MKKLFVMFWSVIAILTLTTLAFASDSEKNIGSAIWSDGINIYTADGSGEITVIPCETDAWAYNHSAVLSDIGSAICVDDEGYTHTADGCVECIYAPDGILLEVRTIVPQEEFVNVGFATCITAPKGYSL